MKIVTVEYRRLRTFGNYQNESVGATAEVGEGETANRALQELRDWVEQQLGDAQERADLSAAVSELRWKKTELEREIDAANQKWLAILEFMKKFGIERPAHLPETLEGLPF